MARCKGCGQVCTCRLVGSDCIDVSGTGQENQPYTVSPILSEDVGNSAECRDDGLYVGAEIVAGLFTGPGIDGDGTAPDPLVLSPPMAKARQTSGTVTAPATAVFTATDFDSGSMWSGAQPTRLTAPLDGIYHLAARTVWASGAVASGEGRLTYIRLNGSTVLDQDREDETAANGGARQPTNLCATDVALTAGDYVELVVQVENVASRDISLITFSMRYVGNV